VHSDFNPRVLADDLESVLHAARDLVAKLSKIQMEQDGDETLLGLVDAGVDIEHLAWHWQSIVAQLELPSDADH
jgi:hypothetical protein